MKNEKTLKRFFEIIPGFLTWTTIIGLLVLSFVKPLWVAVFVITFDLYWVIRTSYLTTLLLVAYRRLARERRHDWLKRCRAVVGPALVREPERDERDRGDRNHRDQSGDDDADGPGCASHDRV